VTYTMAVIEVETGAEHELPADAVTLDAASAHEGAPSAAAPEPPAHVAILPLAFRARDAVFYLAGHRWPALEGRPLRVAPRGRALRS
jgi:hypothetical protein